MAVASVLWRLASPYDAYVSHVARLDSAIERIRYFSDVIPGYAAGLESSGRVGSGSNDDAVARVESFRERLGAAAAGMTDEQFEDFIAHLGGGTTADIDSTTAQAESRMGHMTRGLEEYFAIAGHELATLEARGYNPTRADIARQLRENHLPATTVGEYRVLLHQLGTRAGLHKG